LARLAVDTGHLLSARFADIRRGVENPEQSSLRCGSSFERGLGARRLFGFTLNHSIV
jgi:hypothetical protein